MTDKEILKHISIVEDYYEDIEDNPSLYFCQIYEDADQNKEIDFLTIRKNDLYTDDFAEVEKFAIDYAQQTFSFFRETKDMNNLTTTDLLNSKVLPQNTNEKIKRLLDEPALRISWEDGEFKVQTTKGEQFTIHKDGTVTIDDKTASHMITDNEISFKYELVWAPDFSKEYIYIKDNLIDENILYDFDFITQMTNTIIDKYFASLSEDEIFPAISKVLEDLDRNDWDKIIDIDEYYYDAKSKKWVTQVTVDIRNIKQEIMNSIENLDIDDIGLD